ncbi:hypothetical protein SDC9_117365 [bioreactor metagenome]|uniref:Uncharacterized protein n=1 Tax=bioreactor metagenome TaxID=1076179 RepID=A0A645BY36_9ZZZZ
MAGHDLHDPVPVKVFHEVAQKLVEPPGISFENPAVAEIHRGHQKAEVVDHIVVHHLSSSLVHLAFKPGVPSELLFEDHLGNSGEPLIFIVHQETHFSIPLFLIKTVRKNPHCPVSAKRTSLSQPGTEGTRFLLWGKQPDELRRQSRVKLRSRTGGYFTEGAVAALRLSVRAVIGDGVVAVANGDNPRHQGDLVPRQSVGVSPAVIPFMMMSDRLRDFPHLVHLIQSVRSVFRVHLNVPVFLPRQISGLVQDAVGDNGLPDIMDKGCVVDFRTELLGYFETFRQPKRQGGNVRTVVLCVGVMGFQELQEGHDDAVRHVLVKQAHFLLLSVHDALKPAFRIGKTENVFQPGINLVLCYGVVLEAFRRDVIGVFVNSAPPEDKGMELDNVPDHLVGKPVYVIPAQGGNRVPVKDVLIQLPLVLDDEIFAVFVIQNPADLASYGKPAVAFPDCGFNRRLDQRDQLVRRKFAAFRIHVRFFEHEKFSGGAGTG